MNPEQWAVRQVHFIITVKSVMCDFSKNKGVTVMHKKP